jgi:hypothetical protein
LIRFFLLSWFGVLFPWFIIPLCARFSGVIMGGVGGVWRGLLLVGTGLRSLFMALLVFGVLVYNVFWGGLAFDLARLFDLRLLAIVLPGFAAFAGIWLRRRWGPVLAIVTVLLDLFWWGWLAFWVTRRFGGIDAFLTEYAFFAVFYGGILVLAVIEFKRLGNGKIHSLPGLN